MADRSPGSRAARHRLGTGLKRLREQANLRLDAAAHELECSIAKISRLENGLGPAKLWDVRILLRGLVSQEGAHKLQRYTHVAAQIDLSDTVMSPARARRRAGGRCRRRRAAAPARG